MHHKVTAYRVGCSDFAFFTNLMIPTLASVPQDPRVKNMKRKFFFRFSRFWLIFLHFFAKCDFFAKVAKLYNKS